MLGLVSTYEPQCTLNDVLKWLPASRFPWHHALQPQYQLWFEKSNGNIYCISNKGVLRTFSHEACPVFTYSRTLCCFFPPSGFIELCYAAYPFCVAFGMNFITDNWVKIPSGLNIPFFIEDMVCNAMGFWVTFSFVCRSWSCLTSWRLSFISICLELYFLAVNRFRPYLSTRDKAGERDLVGAEGCGRLIPVNRMVPNHLIINLHEIKLHFDRHYKLRHMFARVRGPHIFKAADIRSFSPDHSWH